MNNEINTSWCNITAKIKALYCKRRELYEELEKETNPDAVQMLSDKISSINYHIEVVRNLTSETCHLREAAKKTRPYA